MHKQITVIVLLGLLLTVPTVTFAECYDMVWGDTNPTSHHPRSYEYDSGTGVIIDMYYSSDELDTFFHYNVIIPKVIDNKPNEDFDRLYALILKAIDGVRFDSICVDGTRAADASLQLQSITF